MVSVINMYVTMYCNLTALGDGCDNDPCANNATCVELDTDDRQYRCECSQGFTGSQCEEGKILVTLKCVDL